MVTRRSADVRYVGQSYTLEIPVANVVAGMDQHFDSGVQPRNDLDVRLAAVPELNLGELGRAVGRQQVVACDLGR